MLAVFQAFSNKVDYKSHIMGNLRYLGKASTLLVHLLTQYKYSPQSTTWTVIDLLGFCAGELYVRRGPGELRRDDSADWKIRLDGHGGTRSGIRLHWTSLQIVREKNPAYGRHRISRPMRIVGPIQFWRGCVIYLFFF